MSLWIKDKKEIPYKEGKIKDIGAHVLLYTHSSNVSDVGARFGISNYLNFNECSVSGNRNGTLNTKDRIVLLGANLSPPLPFEANKVTQDVRYRHTCFSSSIINYLMYIPHN